MAGKDLAQMGDRCEEERAKDRHRGKEESDQKLGQSQRRLQEMRGGTGSWQGKAGDGRRSLCPPPDPGSTSAFIRAPAANARVPNTRVPHSPRVHRLEWGGRRG